MSSSNYWPFWLVVFWGSVVAVLTIVAFIQECGLRRTAELSAWFGAGCLGLVLFGAIVLMAVGVL